MLPMKEHTAAGRAKRFIQKEIAPLHSKITSVLFKYTKLRHKIQLGKWKKK